LAKANLLIPNECVDELGEVLERVGRRELVEPYETIRVRKDGTCVEVSLAVSPIRKADGAGGHRRVRSEQGHQRT
jgi:hypothetical protein